MSNKGIKFNEQPEIVTPFVASEKCREVHAMIEAAIGVCRFKTPYLKNKVFDLRIMQTIVDSIQNYIVQNEEPVMMISKKIDDIIIQIHNEVDKIMKS